MKYIVAVSGGVDSVVLLDMLSRSNAGELIVAHFDHGIRPDSQQDALFVGNLARKYGHMFELERQELGPHASEALARQKRYAFLQALAKKHQAKIITAHHLDDLVETVAINFTRGTGWRGLAVFHSSIARPFINTSKQQLITYAHKQGLQWREDSTNATDAYLRNRIRSRAENLPDDFKRQLRALHAQQSELRRQIGLEIKKFADGPTYNRYLFIQLPTKVALEILRTITGKKLTRPQLLRLLHAIKISARGAVYEAGSGITVQFTARNFTL
jgi:tRNA(Ile)-lysidine synthase